MAVINWALGTDHTINTMNRLLIIFIIVILIIAIIIIFILLKWSQIFWASHMMVFSKWIGWKYVTTPEKLNFPNSGVKRQDLTPE